MTAAQELSRLIRSARKKAGLSQQQVAMDAGLSIKTISTLETGNWAAVPKPQTLRLIADALGEDAGPYIALVIRAEVAS